MKRHEVGPRRSQSVDALLRGTRLLAIAALLALAGGIVSDAVGGSFWARHALLAGLAASVITVMLTVAVINEVLDRRRRERWSILAQFVMLELVRNAKPRRSRTPARGGHTSIARRRSFCVMPR